MVNNQPIEHNIADVMINTEYIAWRMFDIFKSFACSRRNMMDINRSPKQKTEISDYNLAMSLSLTN